METNTIEISNKLIGPGHFQVIAGPCTIDSKESLTEIGSHLQTMGVSFLRGGAYKLRTSSHSFRGLGDIAVKHMKSVCDATGMISVSECIDVNRVDFMAEHINILLVGTRSMYNVPLLEKLGSISNPVILKRGMCATIDEWLQAAQYIVEAGNPNVILCERGIRTFETATRNTLDLSAIPVIKEVSSFPVIVDPSHSTGDRRYVKAMTWAAVAAGADGIMLETHIRPDDSLCDAKQTISIHDLEEIVYPISRIRELLFKEIQLEIFR